MTRHYAWDKAELPRFLPAPARELSDALTVSCFAGIIGLLFAGVAGGVTSEFTDSRADQWTASVITWCLCVIGPFLVLHVVPRMFTRPHVFDTFDKAVVHEEWLALAEYEKDLATPAYRAVMALTTDDPITLRSEARNIWDNTIRNIEDRRRLSSEARVNTEMKSARDALTDLQQTNYTLRTEAR